ncbi:MAG: hypothetical protein RL030_365 [Pseudomonadota bacterium]|jgi:hypothetical protein
MSNQSPLLRNTSWALFLLFTCAQLVQAASDIRTERVHFAKGTSGATLKGTINGSETVDYVFGASKGQHANISLATKNTATYFNILAPGETEVAFFNGSVSDNQYEGELPASGDYRIRVYMMRSAARRNEAADYQLEMNITGKSQASSAGAPAAAGTVRFDSTGKVPCAQHQGQPMGQCDFGVKRTGNGSATVVVTQPGGLKRTITFVGGRATGTDAARTGSGAAFSAQRDGDLNVIHVGDERYEIPDAAVSGG